MITLALWLSTCIVVVSVLRKRPLETVAFGLVLSIGLPYVATSYLTGISAGRLSFGSASWFVFVLFTVHIVRRPGAFGRALGRHLVYFVGLGLVLAAAVLETVRGDSAHGTVSIVDEIFAPLLLFWIIMAFAPEAGTEAIRRLRLTVLVVAALEAALALAQYALHRVILFDHAFRREYWYLPGYDRWMGTTDSALILALLLAAAIPLLKDVRRAWVQNAVTVLLMGGILVTQSRTGLIAGLLATVYLVFVGRTSGLRRFLSVVLLGGAGVVIAASSLSSGILSRIANDSGSAVTRNDSYGYFADHWRPYLFSGGGIKFSYRLSSQADFGSNSFESALIMYSFDIGVVFAVLMFALHLGLIVRAVSYDRTGAWVSALIVIGLCQTFSSLQNACLIGPLLAVLLALTTIERDRTMYDYVEQPDDELAPMVQVGSSPGPLRVPAEVGS